MKKGFPQALHSGRVLLMDGGMGTELLHLGLPAGACRPAAEEWYQANARGILDRYVAAGAACVLTNTFAINPVALAATGLSDYVESICRLAARFADNRTADYVLCDVGPFEPCDEQAMSRIVRQFSCDGVLLETCSDLHQVTPTRQAMDQHLGPDWPLLVSFTFIHTPTGNVETYAGLSPEAAARQTTDHNVVALGVNCGRDLNMDDIVEIVQRFRTVTDLPLFARPNAGTPTLLDGQWVYPQTPAQMAAKLPSLLAAGVAMVGGCCGTTPAHIAAFRPVVDAWNAAKK
jgi:5-methyltetrahydrofolate--homocysteine methyltransferase